MLIEKVDVDSEDTVLVYGGSGGVGHVDVQIASAAGARVVATGSTEEKRAISEELGANATVDSTERSVEAVRPYGRVATTESSSTQDLGAMHEKALSLDVVLAILPILRGERQARLGREIREIAALVDEGDLEPLLDERRYRLHRGRRGPPPTRGRRGRRQDRPGERPAVSYANPLVKMTIHWP